jgi:hypothetical protein
MYGLRDTNAGTAKNMCGSQGVGFAPRALVQSGWPRLGATRKWVGTSQGILALTTRITD